MDAFTANIEEKAIIKVEVSPEGNDGTRYVSLQQWFIVKQGLRQRFSHIQKAYCPGCEDVLDWSSVTNCPSVLGGWDYYCPSCGSRVCNIHTADEFVQPSFTAVSQYAYEGKHQRRKCSHIRFFRSAKIIEPDVETFEEEYSPSVA